MRKFVLALVSFSLVLLTGFIGDNFSPEKAVATQQAGTADSGTIVAALPGFEVKTHGFSFENYGDDEPGIPLPASTIAEYERTGKFPQNKTKVPPTNLTPEEMKRMFGKGVCASQDNGQCILTPPAEGWMKQQNTAMNGGHCEGLAALSLQLYAYEEKRAEFGGNNAGDLKFDGNEKLQREIAYWFSTQHTRPTKDSQLKLTPTQVVEELKKSFQSIKNSGTGELYTMGIYKPDYKEGHSITPYAVKDLGNGKFEILVYENNTPEKPQTVRIDTNNDTWEYGIWEDQKYEFKLPSGSITKTVPKNGDEDVYKGDANTKTLELTKTTPRLKSQVCEICLNNQSLALKSTAQKSNQTQYNQIWIEGEGELLITDAQGRRFGYVNGKLLEEIPGVSINGTKSAELWNDVTPRIYYVPLGIQFSLTVDGSQVTKETETSITMFGPGYDLGIDEIKLEPGQKDTLTLSRDGQTLSYKTNGSESPTIDIGFESNGPDYGFELKGVDLDGGGTINVNLDKTKGVLKFNTTGSQKPGTYALLIERIDDKGEQVFYHDNIEFNANDTAILEYQKWTSNGSALQLKIDRGSQGSKIDTNELKDEQEPKAE